MGSQDTDAGQAVEIPDLSRPERSIFGKGTRCSNGRQPTDLDHATLMTSKECIVSRSEREHGVVF